MPSRSRLEDLVCLVDPNRKVHHNSPQWSMTMPVMDESIWKAENHRVW